MASINLGIFVNTLPNARWLILLSISAALAMGCELSYAQSSGSNDCSLKATMKAWTPEEFGCKGNGRGDSACFQKMLDSVPSGSIIKLKAGANYFNSLPKGVASSWVIRKSVCIVGNGATLSKRRVAVSPVRDDRQSAVLKIERASNVTIVGPLKIKGNEARARSVDESARFTSTREYGRSLAINYGILIDNSNGIRLDDVFVFDNLFNVWARRSTDLIVKGDFSYSGQLYPVVGKDLQYGAGLKLSDVKRFDVRAFGERNTNALLEIEKDDSDGHVVVRSKDSLSSGVTIYRSTNINVDAVVSGSEGVGVQMLQGVQDISGSVDVRNNKSFGLVLFNSNRGDRPSKNLRLTVRAFDNGGPGLHVERKKNARDIYDYDFDYSGQRNASRHGHGVQLISIGKGAIRGDATKELKGAGLVNAKDVDVKQFRSLSK